MFTISVETHFLASHQLVLPDGSKEPLHRHNWVVTADVSSATVNSMGLVMDFRRLRKIVDKTVSDFVDKTLDEFDYFRRNGSSAEMVAKYIYEKVGPKLPKGVTLSCIGVTEEPGCTAKFSG